VTTLITQLREAAAKATPGLYACNSNGEVIAESRTLPSMQVIAKCENIGASDDAKLFALCSPENILALCEALDEARELLQGLTEFHPNSCAYFQGSECDCFLGAKHQQAGQKARAFLAKYFPKGET
jgi:hypothetical protein